MHNIAPPSSFVRLTGTLFFAILLARSSLGLATGTLSISGTPSKSATVGRVWTFTPLVSGAGATPRFSIARKPSWASFNSANGQMTGTPTASNVGTDAGIVTSVSNGKTAVALAAFAIVASTAPPTIAGTPAKSVIAGQPYSFKPTATVAAGKKLSFAIANKPAWASFNALTGALSDTPAAANVGTYSNIDISASDGSAKAALPAFAIDVTQLGSKSTTLSWVAPTENSDGSALTNLAGYSICYGTSKTDLSHMITVRSVGITTYVISNLSAGRYYFAIRAYNTAGVHSSLSNIVTALL
jgi:Putative Ig domain